MDNKEFQWWNHICEQVPSLAKVGFTSLWLPPVHKAANLGRLSMGYDPYNYYDLGEFDRRGYVPTWFGTKAELLDLIQTAHGNGLSLIADIVMNHNNGADEMTFGDMPDLSHRNPYGYAEKKKLSLRASPQCHEQP